MRRISKKENGLRTQDTGRRKGSRVRLEEASLTECGEKQGMGWEPGLDSKE